MRYQLAFGVLFLLATALVDAQEPKKEKPAATTPNYYPLQVDNAWHCKVTIGSNSVDAVWRIAKIEDFKGDQLARLEVIIKDNVVATEHLRQTSAGVFRYRNHGQDITPPMCLLKYPTEASAKWAGDMTVGSETGKYACETAEESIEVAAGKFKTIRVKIRIESKTTSFTTYWFAPDVGIVRQTIEDGDFKALMELQKFEPAKEKKK